MNRRKAAELAVLLVLGLVCAAIVAFLVSRGKTDTPFHSGVAAGLLGGYISVLLQPLGNLFPRQKPIFRKASIAVGPIGAVLLAPLSRGLFVGYWLGAGVSFCFGHSLLLIYEIAHANSATATHRMRKRPADAVIENGSAARRT